MPISVDPTSAERSAPRAGDEIVPGARVVMDRAFSLPVLPDVVWPWIVQLGKDRAGWYLPRSVERLMPPSRRALRVVDPQWQVLEPGDIVPDWGGRRAYFEVVSADAPTSLVYCSERGRAAFSWSISLAADGVGTRVHLRLRIGGVRHERLATSLGGAFDKLTIIGLAAGLRERLR